MKRITRPILRWHGGKWKLAPWIISHFPPHRVYVEPYGGAASVLLQKSPAITEIWNDLESEAVNLFTVLRNYPAALAEVVELTPFSREEYHTLYEATECPIERARRFVCRSFMGQSSKGALRKSGFDSRINPDAFASRVNCLRALPKEFGLIAERFSKVIIENRDAKRIFEQYDREDALFYVDPPYLSDRANHYTHEMDAAGHEELLGQILGLSGMVVLSGYSHELYESRLKNWYRVSCDASADTGAARTEVLWINPAASSRLNRRLFDEVIS